MADDKAAPPVGIELVAQQRLIPAADQSDVLWDDAARLFGIS